MGNTLVFKNKVYNVNVGDTLTVGENGLVEVNLSSDSGNLLEARDNGLYYGLVPLQNTFYVSETLGNDSNAGTRNAPLKTFHQALDLVNKQKTGGAYWIRLRAGENFNLRARPWLGNAEYQIYVAGYDDATYGDDLSFGIYSTYAMQEYNRPKLTFDTFTGNDGFVHAASINAARYGLHFYGIEVHYTSSAGSTSSGGSYHYATDLDYRGSVIYVDGVMAIGSAASIRLDTSRFETINASKVFQADSNPLLFYINSAGGGSGVSVSSAGKSGTSLVNNVRSKLTVTNAVGNADYDVSTKTLFGYSTNWDIFATSN